MDCAKKMWKSDKMMSATLKKRKVRVLIGLEKWKSESSGSLCEKGVLGY